MLKNRLLSIGIGTLFAFIIVISAIWCVSTYYDYKMHEAEASSTHSECNVGNTASDDRQTTSPSMSRYSRASTHLHGPFERYPLSRSTQDQLSTVLHPPPPYYQIVDTTNSCSSNSFSLSRYDFRLRLNE